MGADRGARSSASEVLRGHTDLWGDTVGTGRVAQVFVFDGDEYLGWDCFETGEIRVGSGEEDDLILPEPLVPATQASIHVNGTGVIVEDLSGIGAVRVNGEPIKTWRVGPLDAVTVGRFTLKIRTRPVRRNGGEPAPETLPERPPESFGPVVDAAVVESLGRLADSLVPTLVDSPDRRDAFDSLMEALLQDGDEGAASLVALVTGALGEAAASPVPDPGPAQVPAADGASEAVAPPLLDSLPEGCPPRHGPEAPLIDGWPVSTGAVGTAVEMPSEPDPDRPVDAERVVEVIRLRGRAVVEVRLLGPAERYEAQGEGGPFPVAENAGDGTAWFFVDPARFRAWSVAKKGRLVPLDLGPDGPERRPLPRRGKVVVGDGSEEFVLRFVPRPRVSAPLPVAPPSRLRPGSLAASALLHGLVLVLGAVGSLSGSAETPPVPPVLVELEAPLPEPKPLPRAAALDRATAPAHRPDRPPALAKPAAVRLSAASRAVAASAPAHEEPAAAREPDTEGPVAEVDAPPPLPAPPPRDVRKTGILRALGVPEGVSAGAKAAVAAVAAIDGVRTADAGEVPVQVAGLVAKLGKGRTGVPAVGPVGTRGGAQIFAARADGSPGGLGSGTAVGALEKGQTGRRQVRALVSADVRRSAQVQGGMSREEVRKVIDRHMDEVTSCYESSLIADPSLMGKLTFEWRILTSGAVGEISIQSSSIRSDDLHACIQRAIKSWQFPKPRGAEVIVSHPFIFDVVGF